MADSATMKRLAATVTTAASILFLAMAVTPAFPAPAAAPATQPATAPAMVNVPAEQALAQLQAGNDRFVAGKSEHPRADAARRQETATGRQHPIAAVLGCSDSRCGPEIVFDQGIGDIFAVRVAGNVADIDQTGSIEYGADHLGIPLLVVLGHSKCGAVSAVVMGEHVHGNVAALATKIALAVAKAKTAHPDLDPPELLPFAVEQNVWQSVDDLFRHSPTIRELVKGGKLKVVGAVQDLESGKVKWLGEPADLARLLAYGDGQPVGHP